MKELNVSEIEEVSGAGYWVPFQFGLRVTGGVLGVPGVGATMFGDYFNRVIRPNLWNGPSWSRNW